jgi:DNA invertase Pin-like site-specific DNA recombinase
MRVAIYTRLSPNPDKDDTISQEVDLTEFANRNKWEVIKVYKDILVSGAKKGKDRPQFLAMMEAASKKKFDIILFWALDRFSREGALETLQYLRQLENWGVGYKSYTEQYFDSCGIFKDAIIGIMATLAKQERVRLIERTNAGLDRARAKGVRLGRKPTVIDKVRVIKLRGEGLTYTEIAKECKTSVSKVFRVMEFYKKIVARSVYREAIKYGELVRPSFCSVCSKECLVDGHHPDYDKPLDVVWVCKRCHAEIHAIENRKTDRDSDMFETLKLDSELYKIKQEHEEFDRMLEQYGDIMNWVKPEPKGIIHNLLSKDV